jgi:hypothetical protein
MADQTQRASEFRNWVQMLFVVAGVGVGIWEFVFKEILVPASAPINLTTELNIKQAGLKGPSDKTKDQFVAIELSVTARNPSSRDVFLLKNCWYALGESIATRRENAAWTANMTKQIDKGAPMNEGAFYTLSDVPVVDAAQALDDEVLHPGEVVSTSMVFFVPQGTFDILRVHVEIPTTAAYDTAEAVWTVTRETGCSSTIYRRRNGARAEKITDMIAAYKDRNIQLQTVQSTRELSMWPSKN